MKSIEDQMYFLGHSLIFSFGVSFLFFVITLFIVWWYLTYKY